MNNQQYSPRGFTVLPPVVKNLLIINGLFFLSQFMFQQVFRIDLVDYLGMHYFGSSKFNPIQMVTYMFLHSTQDFTHLLFNMFALWMFGYSLENIWGGKRFLTYYIVTGIGAALIHMIVMYFSISGMQAEASLLMNSPDPASFNRFILEHFPHYQNSLLDFINSWSLEPRNPALISEASDVLNKLIEIRKDVPTVGASGAVFGILLAFGMLFPNTLIFLYFFFPIRAKWFVILYGALELYMGISNNPGDNVAHFAHLGGMIFGFILIKYWDRKIKRFNQWD